MGSIDIFKRLKVYKIMPVTARKYNTIISYDLNYRPSLWKIAGGEKRAQEVNRHILKYVDVVFGNIKDFTTEL